MKGWKKIFHANRDQKKARVAILIPDKIDFKIKPVTRDSERSHIMIKGPILKKIQQLYVGMHPTEEDLNTEGKC